MNSFLKKIKNIHIGRHTEIPAFVSKMNRHASSFEFTHFIHINENGSVPKNKFRLLLLLHLQALKADRRLVLMSLGFNRERLVCVFEPLTATISGVCP